MIRNLVIFSLCLISIQASGEFNILSFSGGIDFKGNEPLNSDAAPEVVLSAMGEWADDAQKWSGLYTLNPFALPKYGCIFVVDGVESLNFGSKAKTYPMTGSSAGESMKALYSKNDPSLNIIPTILSFPSISDGLATIEDMFGEPPSKLPVLKATNNLKPNIHSGDKYFLTVMSYINEAITKYAASSIRPDLLIIIINLEPIANAHGEKSAAMTEAVELVKSSIEDMNKIMKETAKGGYLTVAIAEKSEPNRFKRETLDANSNTTQLNLATYYNEDYPVIFNIILWFMVVFGFSLLAICYAIGSMDPGRDSIIYRMTSTRMKKDN